MNNSNLPPGVTPSMVDGANPAYEAFCEKLTAFLQEAYDQGDENTLDFETLADRLWAYMHQTSPAADQWRLPKHWTDERISHFRKGDFREDDAHIATEVRMLMRNQLNHEHICVTARDRIAVLSRRAYHAEQALLSLTPSGSEYFCQVGDQYYVDVRECMKYILTAREAQRVIIRNLALKLKEKI